MAQQKYPRVHLTIDNCFAIKRWPKPSDWARVVREEIGGVSCVEASTDLEIDPQFCPPDYTERWIEEVRNCKEKYGTKVVSFYSGYVTYRSMSLLNWDKSYSDRFRDTYIFGAIDLAAELDATAGGTLQAFGDSELQDSNKFYEAEKRLMDYSVQCAEYAAKKGVAYGFEQMYTPTQGWWRIKDVKRYMHDVYKLSGKPLYTTIDTAHMAGQHLFYMPAESDFEAMIKAQDTFGRRLPDEMVRMIEEGTTLENVKRAAEKFEFWFSQKGDEDVYKWMEEVSCYSPIMHLQQTDGSYSSHRPFTEKFNKEGIIKPREVLGAIVKCYDKPVDKNMPPRTEDIYLAFEVFFGVTDSNADVIEAMKESVGFWREVLKEDGKTADYWL